MHVLDESFDLNCGSLHFTGTPYSEVTLAIFSQDNSECIFFTSFSKWNKSRNTL